MRKTTPAPTLADELYRMSFEKETIQGWTDNALWRKALTDARRFVIDDNMSSFMGELSCQAFARPISQRRKINMTEHLRLSARLPHHTTWIEYNLRACQTRANEIFGRAYNPSESPKREGWLLRRHPNIETAFIAQIITDDPIFVDMHGYNMWTFPATYAWTVDHDTVLPWRSLPFGEESSQPSYIATGVHGYDTAQCGIVFSDLVKTPNRPKAVSLLLEEWCGVLRRMWALLATINDLPTEVTEVRASKGFMGRRNYRKFLDHKTITLTVPTKLYRKTARDALSLAHRRGGPVREHWRRDWRRPLSPLCDHEWGADATHIFCNHCKGRKIWVHEHSRGDASRGYTTHDFLVTHDE